MHEPIGSTVVALWRGSPHWRQLVLAAAAATALAMIGRMQSGGSQAPPPSPSSGGGYATVQPTAPQPQQATVRLADFHKESAAAEATKGEGEGCEMRDTALRRLHPEDIGLALGPQKDDLQKAQACTPLLQASDTHWSELAQAVAVAEAAPSRAAVQALQSALGKLDTFDHSRSAQVQHDCPARIGRLAKGLDDHDEAIKSLARQLSIYGASGGTSIDAGRQVTDGLAKWRALPVHPALAGAQADVIAGAERVVAEIDASEQRLQTFAQAWQQRDADPHTVANLLSQLSDVDRARWDAVQGRPAKLAAIEAAVAAQMPAVLQGLLSDYEHDGTRVLADRITAVQALSTRLHAPSPSANTQARLDRVHADIERSRQRLAHLVAVEQAWNAKTPGMRNAALEQDVLAAVRALRAPGSAQLNRYDAPALGDTERRAWATLHSALAEIQGTIADPAVKLPVSIDASAITDRLLEGLAHHIGEALEASGFAVSRSPEAASIRLAVSEARLKRRADSENGGSVFELTLHPRVVWTYRGTETDLGSLTGVGEGDDARAGIEAAQVQAAKRIAEEIAGRMKRGS